MARKIKVLTACGIFFYLLGLQAFGESAAQKALITQAVAKTENESRELQCSNSRVRFAELTCERKSTAMPVSIDYLEIPSYYSTSLLWQDILLKYSQTLYSDMPKDLRTSAAVVLRECIAACSRGKQCENEVLEYFGVQKSFFSWWKGSSKINNKNSRRNTSLAAALGESLYLSEAGSLINRHTDIKVCTQLKEEAKQNQCDLSPTRQ